VVVACYDGSVHGWRGAPAGRGASHGDGAAATSGTAAAPPSSTEPERRLTTGSTGFELRFAFPAHASCVRAVACRGGRLATGSQDESVQTYDVETRRVLDRAVGSHRGEVTAVAFVGGRRNLVTGDSAGAILVWRDANVVHELRGHKASPVTSIAVHPTVRSRLPRLG